MVPGEGLKPENGLQLRYVFSPCLIAVPVVVQLSVDTLLAGDPPQ
jgi:hypothetical protein